MKIIVANPSSYIRAEFGSWTSISLKKAKGAVETEITQRNGETTISLNFSFFKEYLYASIIAIFATLVLCMTMWLRTSVQIASVNPTNVGSFLLRVSLLTAGLSLATFLMAIGIVAYSASSTRRRLVEEFKTFVQSLPAQKS
jgi:cell division protein FtsX